MAADATRFRVGLQRWAETTMRRAVPAAAELARHDPRVPRKTGELAGAIQASPTILSTGTRWFGNVSAPIVQAATTHRGARPHPIPGTPILVFHWAKRGRVVAFRHVNHPGNPARPWWDAVIRDAYRQALIAAARSAASA